MTRHINFWNDRDAPITRIPYDLLHFILSIEAAVFHIIGSRPRIKGKSQDRSRTRRTQSSQIRKLFDFDPPPRVVTQVPVKIVELVQRQQIDISLHICHGKKMPADVEVHSPIGESG